MASQRDYYQILGVSETATTDEIKKAFRRLAKQYHPDRNPNKQAAERFKEINEAHDVLSDAEKRKKYDQLRRYGAFAGAGQGYGRAGGSAGGPDADFDLSDLGSFGGLGDLFSSIFGRRGAGAPLDDEEEIETAISIPFRVAALGGKVPVTLTLPEVCPTCSGSGGAPGATFSTCPVCRGRGTISSQRCPTCQGSGEVRQEKHLTISIPAGTEDGTRLRLKGQGAKGKGDIVVAIQVEPDRFFRREGLDVIAVVPINLAQALLGSKIKVRTLDGKRVVLKVPPGTQHGQKCRLPGQGIERNGRRGDQYVEVHVQIPEKLTPEQEAALREFADKSGMKH